MIVPIPILSSVAQAAAPAPAEVGAFGGFGLIFAEGEGALPVSSPDPEVPKGGRRWPPDEPTPADGTGVSGVMVPLKTEVPVPQEGSESLEVETDLPSQAPPALAAGPQAEEASDVPDPAQNAGEGAGMVAVLPPTNAPDMGAALRSVFIEAGFLPPPAEADRAPALPLAQGAEGAATLRALAPTVAELAQSGPGAATELQLAPEELGRLRIVLRQDGADMQVLLTAERADTQDLLRRNVPLLAEELRQAGFAATSFSFGTWGDAPPRSPPPERKAMAEPLPAAPPPAMTLPPVAGLDLRL